VLKQFFDIIVYVLKDRAPSRRRLPEMRDVVQKSVGGPESKANLGSAWTGVQGRSFISVSVRLVCTTTQTHLPQNHTLGELKSAVITM